ncbi:DUF6273 domain-containing protein [Collinsella aerofaciens]|uniref:DUF6273 domain-containing protein n=1 Tax=Collinsella aerofaciens TaxID=74426 RepID=UPI003D78D6B3
MHVAAVNLRGGVAHRAVRLRGQSIIEYVLIIAIIGLVIVFAGPSVAGAIRNQFNQVTNTVDSGTESDNFISSEEKAYREAMKTVASKEAKDWTLDEQKAAATDIAKNGTSSVVYAKAKAAMDAGTTWSMKLTNGKTMTYRIIGINHDDLADGSGKAGLTFHSLDKSIYIDNNELRADSNIGGWEKSELRQRMNSGDIWNLLPSDLQAKVKPVSKFTNNVSGADRNALVTKTVDKVFLLSNSEIVGESYSNWSAYSWITSEGFQYEAFQGKAIKNGQDNPAIALSDDNWWERSAAPDNSLCFLQVTEQGEPSSISRTVFGSYVCPAWCF